MMMKLFVLIFFCFVCFETFGNDQIMISFPRQGQDLSSARTLNLQVQVNANQMVTTKATMTRNVNNRSLVVNELVLDTRTSGRLSVNFTPPGHFCEDNYTINLFDSQNSIFRSVTFKAGSGTCFSNDRNKFINLESNLTDLKYFAPSHQGDRDTCGAFASASALEAAYKRLKGKDVLLSQNYIHHIIKSSWLTASPLFLYENQSSFFGGNSTKDALKFLNRYRVPELKHAPYQTQEVLSRILSNLGIPNLVWNSNPQNNRITQDQIDSLEYHESHISLDARLNAIYGISDYKAHENTASTSINDIENYLKSGKEVMFAIKLFWMDSVMQTKTKLYSPNGPGGQHLMLAVGYDKIDPTGPYLLVKNSWGDGILRVHYDVLRNQNLISYGVIEKVTESFWPNPDRWIGRWEMKHDQWRGELIIRRTFEPNVDNRQSPYRIGEYHHQNGKRYCAYGGFTNGSNTLLMKIDFDREVEDRNYNISYSSQLPSVNVMAKDVCPPEARGQDFSIDMGLRVHNKGVGTTVWNNKTYPVEIWR
jgi:hypothetical protein